MHADEKPCERARTLDDLAKAVGVSRTTASNAFNRPEQLSAELRGRILRTAEALGYPGPNPMARMLRTGRTGSIGLLFGDTLPYALDDDTSIALLKGLARVCEKRRSGLLLLPVMDDAAAAQAVRAAAVDGFILYCLPDGSPVVPQVLERRLPVVTVDSVSVEGVPSISIDDLAGAQQAAAHLLELGHRRLAILSLDLQTEEHFGVVTRQRRSEIHYRPTALRLEGYGAAMREKGLDLRRVPVFECPGNSEEHARRATLELLAGRTPPTGILAMSDRFAIGAFQAASQLGLQVPRDLSVVGFDDIPLAARFRPALTTVRQPLVEKGVAAAEMLLKKRTPAISRVLETRLIQRESTGPAPGR